MIGDSATDVEGRMPSIGKEPGDKRVIGIVGKQSNESSLER